MKKIFYFMVFSICMILGCGLLAFLYQFHPLLNECFISNDHTLQFAALNDASKEGDTYTVTGEDAYLVFDLGQEQEVLNGKMYLGEPVDQDTDIQVFYADGGMAFSEEHSYFTVIEKGEDDLVFELPGGKTRYVRIDIVEDKGYHMTIHQVTAAASVWTAYVKLYLSFYNLRIAFLLYLGAVLVWLARKKWNVINDWIGRHEYFTAVSLIVICVTVLYFKYITGEVYYIFTDLGADSYNQTYPYLVNTARRISYGLWKEFFNFAEGLGNSNGSIVLGLDNWITLFGEKNVAYLMGISQWLKVILTGIFTYHFSRVYGNGHQLSFVAAFAYAFNAFVMIRGAWASYPNLALLLIIWLTAYEYYHSCKKIYLLPLATVMFFYSLDIYDCLLWGAALAAYIVFREFSEQRSSKLLVIQLCKIELLYACFSLLGMADTVVHNLNKTLQSHRFLQSTNNFIAIIKNDFWADISEISTAFLQTIGMTICGVSDYLGSGNYLEGPSFYCSILFFIFIPVAVFNMEYRKRRFYIFAYIFIGIYILVRPMRYFLNGFSGPTYKLSSLWIIAIMFLTALFFLKLCFSEQIEIRKKSTAIFNITVLITVLCMFISLRLGYVARLRSWVISMIFVTGYGIIMNLMFFRKISRKAVSNILCICIIAEVLLTSWNCVNNRKVIRRTDFEEGMLYNDTTKNTVDDLRNVDLDWYRIEKKYGTVFLCDSLAQDYYGTMSYVGGTGIGSGVIDYYFDLELPHSGDHYLYGSGEDVYVGALLGIKYYITKSGQEPFAYGLTYLKTWKDVDIYENTLALPLAYAYDKAVSYDTFQMFSGTDKRKIMLGGCIVDDCNSVFYRNNFDTVDTCEIYKYEPVQKDEKYYLDIPKNHVLIIKLRTNSNELWNMYCESEGKTVYSPHYSFEAGEENTIELYSRELDAIYFSNNDVISNVEFYYQDADTYYASTKAAIDKLNGKALQVESFSESYIKGQVVCDQEMILATSIPYDENWHIYVDDRQVDTMKVNVGFIGAKLSSGRHKVDIIYESNSWIYDNKFKCAGAAFAVLIILMQFKKKRRAGYE